MSHLKRIAAPNTWPIKRKELTFTTKPAPGAKKLAEAVSLNFVLRNMLYITRTARETKKLLNTGVIAINGVVRKDPKYAVGVLDIVLLQPTKEQYFITFSSSGKLQAKKLKHAVHTRLAKIIGKTILKKKKLQLNLHDGTNLIVAKDEYATGDTAVLEGKKLVKCLKYEKGALIYLIGGKHRGKIGTIEEIHFMNNMQKHRIVVKSKQEKFETLKDYAFVIEKPFEE